jgi:hypothetical protein
MVLEWSLILGAGLLILSLVGIFGPENPDSWLAWCDFFGAWATYFVAADIKPNSTRAQRIGCPLALATGLFVACFLALRGKEISWLIWPTFGFASEHPYEF